MFKNMFNLSTFWLLQRTINAATSTCDLIVSFKQCLTFHLDRVTVFFKRKFPAFETILNGKNLLPEGANSALQNSSLLNGVGLYPERVISLSI